MSTLSEPTQSCNSCQKPQSELPEPLKRCARCLTTPYCGRECQRADWKTHKLVCTSPGAAPQNSIPSTSSTGRHNPGFDAINQLLGLSSDDYLHKLTQAQAFEQIIDCFRLRMEDEATFGGNLLGIYNEEDPRKEFKKFLNLAEERKGILPKWWNGEKRKECEDIAERADRWSDIRHVVEKSDIMEHYGDNVMPMKLRVLGEKIYGKGFV